MLILHEFEDWDYESSKSEHQILIEESMKLKNEYKKDKYMNKFFVQLWGFIIYTVFMCYVFSKLDNIINFNSKIYIQCIIAALYVIFNCIIYWKILSHNCNKKKMLKIFIMYTTVTAIFSSGDTEISQLKELIIKFIILFVIFALIFIICKYIKHYIIATIILMLAVFILYKLDVLNMFSIFGFEFNIFLLSFFVNFLNKQVEETTNVDTLYNSSHYLTLIVVYNIIINYLI